MKIDRTSGPGSVSAPRRSGKSSGSGTRFDPAVADTPQAEAPAAMAPTGPVAAVDALLSLQETQADAEARSKGLHRARSMLELLEEIRRGLLLGQIPVARLEQLADAARSRREGFVDPALADILGEIELRAEVELAKLGH